MISVVLLATSFAGVGAARADECSQDCSTSTPAPSDTPASSDTPTPSGTPDPTSTPTPTPTATSTPPPSSGSPTPTPGHTSDPTHTDASSPTPSASDSDAAPAAAAGSGVSAATIATLQSAVTSAQAALDAAQTSLDAAKSEYSAAKDAFATAKALYKAADAGAERAKVAAKAAAAKLMLALHQTHSDAAVTTFGAIMGDGSSASGDLLDRLTAATQLGDLNGSMTTLTARAVSSAKHAKKAAAQAREDRAAVTAIPLAEKRAAKDDAQAAVDAAKASVDAALNAMVAATSAGVDTGFVDDSQLAPGTWVDPVRGPITDIFGPRPSQPAGSPVFHPGDDIGAACMTVIVAATDGVVSYAGPYSGYGNFILLDHADGVQTAYGHISDGTIMVSPGEHVTAGEPIARVGSTGESTGCHLHFEVRVNGTAIDPMPFMANRHVVLGQS